MEKITGIIIMTSSVALYALLYPLLKKTNQQIPPFTVMAISIFVLFAISLTASIIFEGSLQMKPSVIKSNLSLLVIIGIANFAAFWLTILGFKFFPVWQQNMFFLLSPIFAAIFAYLLLGENINNNLFIGLSIMGIGLFIALR